MPKDKNQRLPKPILHSPDIFAFAEWVKTNKPEKVVVMAGAGLSTSAGIPDFRTPGTGIYDNLQQYKLQRAEDIFTLSFFRQNPKPFFALAKELMPGNFQPTISHHFLRLMEHKGMLCRLYTQNIDQLEIEAKISPERVVQAHGTWQESTCVGCLRVVEEPLEESDSSSPSSSSSSSLAEQADDTLAEALDSLSLDSSKGGAQEKPATRTIHVHYQGCAKKYSQQWTLEKIKDDQVPRCESCPDGIVKPDIVFFGEGIYNYITPPGLPDRFHELRRHDLQSADALIVLGTSLQVYPFAALIDDVAPDTPRLLINREKVGQGVKRGFDFSGTLGHKFRRDAFYQGDIDEGTMLLARLLGWEDELKDLHNEFSPLAFVASRKEADEGSEKLKV